MSISQQQIYLTIPQWAAIYLAISSYEEGLASPNPLTDQVTLGLLAEAKREIIKVLNKRRAPLAEVKRYNATSRR